LSVQLLLKELDFTTLAISLLNAKSEIKEKIYSNVSDKIKSKLKEKISELEEKPSKDLIIEMNRGIINNKLDDILK